ncbi:MAG: hypothetical protein ACE5D8_01970 [Fidelibacterota bacterium]
MKIETALNAIRPEQQALNRTARPDQPGHESVFEINGTISESDRTETVTTPARVLTAPEKESLHMLFGAEKPDTMQFYNQKTTPTTPKGHFIDLIS